jgi:hypothetical protein
VVSQSVQTDSLLKKYSKTLRTDRWWFEPLMVGIGLFLFILYSTISAALLGNYWPYEIGPYLSPFFEPLFYTDILPKWISPAIFILWAPLSFRMTCYYYRRAYYRSYFLSPPACAVTEPASSYSGESTIPLVVQNIHRFAMYGALIFVPILWSGAIKSYYWDGELGIGVGSIILTLNAFLLSGYTFGCHSFRHLIGGGLNSFTGSKYQLLRKKAWDIVSAINAKHRAWAWSSLIVVGFSDLYVHLVASEMIVDLNTWSSFF